MNLRINSSNANLRVSPNTSKAPLSNLPAGHLVVALDEPQGNWQRCQTQIDNHDLEGFVHLSLLRAEINPEVDRLAELAGAEYRDFHFGKRNESHPDSRERIKAYWLSFSDEAQDAVKVAWSAAFISFIVKNANLSKFFKFSGRHTDYLSDSKLAKLDGDSTRAYWAVRLSERKIQIGDLIGAYRNGKGCGSAIQNYDSLPGDFCSHCDIVIAIRDNKAITLGGNLSQTVKSTEIVLTETNHVPEGNKRITVMARNF